MSVTYLELVQGGDGQWTLGIKAHNLIRITNHYYTWSVALMVMGSMVMT